MSSKRSGRRPDSPDGNDPPSCTIIAGPNGSGKSTIYELLQPVGEFVNADLIARSLLGKIEENIELFAARMTLHRLDKLLEDRRDFVFETTLSGHQPLSLMRRAKGAGFQVGLVFVVLADVDLNVKRVAERVSRGGHDIPEATIRRRYAKSFSNLRLAVSESDGCLVYDNSQTEIELLVRASRGVVELNRLDLSRHHHAIVAAAFD